MLKLASCGELVEPCSKGNATAYEVSVLLHRLE